MIRPKNIGAHFLMKSKLFLITLVLAVSSVFVYFFVNNLALPASDDTQSVDFLINKGASVAQIGNKLEDAGLIKSGVLFKFYVQLTNSTNKIQAGEFQLSPSLNLYQVVDKLKKGPTELWVTIPEGLRREEIAVKFATILNKDDAFITEFMTLTNGKEGYLYPDTYLFPKSVDASRVVNKLLSTFEQKAGQVIDRHVIMASLLERETITDQEKPIVAGILYKRLENGWPLQIDATLQYAKDSAKYKTVAIANKYWEPAYAQDKEINSAFNTYKNLGLPPEPISNPGIATIKASINPQESEYWYYIHDNNGVIRYARTLDEHNANIAKYLR